MLPGDGSLDSCVCWLKVTGGKKRTVLYLSSLCCCLNNTALLLWTAASVKRVKSDEERTEIENAGGGYNKVVSKVTSGVLSLHRGSV